jgi:hypothetical protein
MLTLSVIGLIVVSSFACQKAPNANTTAMNVDNKAVTASPAEQPAEQAPVNADSDGSPTKVYKLAYKYRKEKNVEGLKSIFSKKVLDFLSEMGKSDKKSLDDEVREMTETPQWTSDESRNEKIAGDRASIQYRDTDGDWKTMDFVNEGGKWKLSMPEADSTDDNTPAPTR